ncbi:glycosyl hydrolase family 26 [Vibrio cholerae]|nr:glycosyl hydrolase family 26 [Vibrio cholerae]GIA80850.1 glycosyl hydrolase family 26 [Vibrio cholerae]
MKKQYLTLITLLLLSGCTGNDEERMNIREQVSTASITIDNEGEKPPVLYTANINSKTIFCGGQINGMEQLDNLGSDSGTFSSGFNATAFLQPGENELNLWTVPVGAYNGDFTYHENDRCELTIFGAFPDGNKQELSNLTATIIDGKPNVKTSTIYPDNHKTPLANVDGVTPYRRTIFTRPIYVKTIPRWRWVDATPIREDNPEQMKQLYRAYTNLLTLMEKRDFEGLKMAWSLSNREKAMAEAYYSTPDEFFDAVGFESTFERYGDGEVRPRREWHEYKLKSYMGGRLVRLEDTRGHSPLRIGSTKNDLVYSPTPYFSMIDERVVVSR